MAEEAPLGIHTTHVAKPHDTHVQDQQIITA